MTREMFRDDPYLMEADAEVIAHTDEGGVILDGSIFYPTGGGQPGDNGWLYWDGQRMEVATAVREPGGQIILIPAMPDDMPPVGQTVSQRLDWDRRHRHMRVHTALHLLSVVIPLPVTGGAIGSQKGRLDFHMPEAPEDKEILLEKLNLLIDHDLPVTEEWITEEELDANPSLVKTMSVQPPRGAGRIRLIRIGTGDETVDLQPCGGTHVGRTGEIGAVHIGKIEKKGRQNRRVNLVLDI